MADPKQIADALAQDQLLAQFNRREGEAQPWYMKPMDMEGRATFLPFKDTLPGSVMNQRELALPGLLAGAVNAFTAPGRVSTQGFDAPEEALNLAGYVMGGGIGTSAGMKAPTGIGGKNLFSSATKPIDYAKALESEKPRLYHGAIDKFNKFNNENSHLVDGVWATDSRSYAQFVADNKSKNVKNSNPNVMEIDANYKNPMRFDIMEEALKIADEIGVNAPKNALEAQELLSGGMGWDTVVRDLVNEAKSKKHDALILHNFNDNFGPPDQVTNAYVIFNPKNIKILEKKGELERKELLKQEFDKLDK